MPRQARLDFEGCLHHVINRGLERRAIFRDSQDYKNFKDSLARFCAEDEILCYAWVLIPNHFHLLLKTGKVPLARFMARLQTSYAGQFNRRHRRSGRLFQNRYKSIVCDEDVYFKELLAYIHLNPLRAKLVTSLAELGVYPWSGHRALLGSEKAPWQAVGETLRHFGQKEARRRYLVYLGERKGVESGALSGGGLIRSLGGLTALVESHDKQEYDTRILGDGEFVRQIDKKTTKISQWPRHQGTMKDLLRTVSAKEGVPMEELTVSGKTTARGSRARAVFAHLAVESLGEKKVNVAEALNVTPLAVTKLWQKGGELAKKWHDRPPIV